MRGIPVITWNKADVGRIKAAIFKSASQYKSVALEWHELTSAELDYLDRKCSHKIAGGTLPYDVTTTYYGTTDAWKLTGDPDGATWQIVVRMP